MYPINFMFWHGAVSKMDYSKINKLLKMHRVWWWHYSLES